MAKVPFWSRARPVPEMPRDEITRRLSDRSLTLVNALSAASFAVERIPGSLNLPVAVAKQRAPSLLPDRAREIVVYCGGFT